MFNQFYSAPQQAICNSMVASHGPESNIITQLACLSNNMNNQQVNQNTHQMSDVKRGRLLASLVDDRRRDQIQDASILKVLRHVKYQNPEDRIIQSIEQGVPIAPHQLVQVLVAGRNKDIRIAQLIENVILDRQFNRQTDSGF